MLSACHNLVWTGFACMRTVSYASEGGIVIANGLGERSERRIAKNIGASRVVPTLLAISAFLLYGLNNTETTALPNYIMTLGGGPFIAGFQNSAFVLLAVMLRIPLERVTARHGGRFTLVLGALGYTLPCLPLSLCSELWVTVLWRMVQALGLAAFQPSVALYLTRVSPPSLLGRRLGIVRFATTASLMVGPVSLFPLVALDGYPLFFIVLFAIGACGSAVAFLLPSESSAASSSSVIARPTTRNRNEGHGTFAQRSMFLLIAGPFLLASGYSVIVNFGQMLSQEALEMLPDGILFTCISAGGLIGSLVAGWSADIFGVKRSATVCIAASGLGSLLMALGDSSAVLAGSALCGAGYFGSTATFVTAAGTSVNPAIAHSFLARQQSGIDVGIIIGGIVSGLMLQRGLSISAVFLVTSVTAFACIMAWSILYPSKKESSQEGTWRQ